MLSKLELKIYPILQVLLLMGLMKYLAWLFPAQSFYLIGEIWLAAGFLLLAVLIIGAGVFSFRQAKTTLDPRNPNKSAHLVTDGIYQISRNPMYLGFLLLLVSWFFYLSNWYAFIAIPIFIVYMNRFQIQPEEKMMQAKFGQTYKHYQQTVRRWI
ncbi:isoprenylcysteine carboxylmethyltransferase family protein [Catenovulum sp. 2E275]|uniref:methyltransferase family protein n=1 Tax=Catenovulum sp. 2E275 TaxID=2980497 RepID=UPI0021D11C95|nr:isoprenylcysteine carboxylmethyltransferase family protein [Catenovulum sp. 2E275]MCU4675212.1 isoprenylcysteine carboxylmethyltransferase family protein [Catenovulum sp. 2E275]